MRELVAFWFVMWLFLWLMLFGLVEAGRAILFVVKWLSRTLGEWSVTALVAALGSAILTALAWAYTPH